MSDFDLPAISNAEAESEGLLSGRFATCAYAGGTKRCRDTRNGGACGCNAAGTPSSRELAFFEYLGPGSDHAVNTCKCGYARCTHSDITATNPITERANDACRFGKFTPAGPRETDRFYCGCFGWD